MPVRVLADRTLAEIYIADGLGVVSTPVLSPSLDPTKAGAFLSVLAAPGGGSGMPLKMNASAWSMGCGWARYP